MLVAQPVYLIFKGIICRQLQPLVARMHCGDLQFILRTLLNDRKTYSDPNDAHRSIYRQMLFLKCILFPGSVDIGN